MKRTLLLLTMAATNAIAVERQELMPLIEAASTNRESAYLEVRNKIVEHGTDALPFLAEIGQDESLPWRQQLVARICHERIERKEDIEGILATDWFKHPKLDPQHMQVVSPWLGVVMGLAVPTLQDLGLLYYCIEVRWKATDEGLIRRDDEDWGYGCASIIKDSPEGRIWLPRICDDVIENTPPFHPDGSFPYWLGLLVGQLASIESPEAEDIIKKYKRKFSPRLPITDPFAPPTVTSYGDTTPSIVSKTNPKEENKKSNGADGISENKPDTPQNAEATPSPNCTWFYVILGIGIVSIIGGAVAWGKIHGKKPA